MLCNALSGWDPISTEVELFKEEEALEVSMPFRTDAPFLPVLERIERVNAYLSINALSG